MMESSTIMDEKTDDASSSSVPSSSSSSGVNPNATTSGPDMEQRAKGINNLVEKAKMFSNFLGNQLKETAIDLYSKNGKTEGGDDTPTKGKGKEKAKAKKASDTRSLKQKVEEAHEKDTQSVSLHMQPKLVTGGVLRDYQLAGVEWLIKHWMNGMNGILADEMGLGKTIQVIAFLAHLWDNKVNGPSLIIAPLSVIQNWVNEFTKWTPAIPVLLYHDTKEGRVILRDKMAKLAAASSPYVVVTNYDLAINDAKHFQKFKWKYLIVDEAHRLKRFNCRLILSLQNLHTENRLLMTGTPLQNNIIELWSLLHFVLPEVFDDVRSFKDWFNFDTLLDQEGSAKVGSDAQNMLTSSMGHTEKFVTKLHEILQPFFLRRIKEDVGLGLPPKFQLVLYAPFTKAQHALYEGLRSKDLKNRVIGGKRINTNAMLMQLRKASNHMFLFEPALAELYLRDPEGAKVAVSEMRELDEKPTELTRLRKRTSKVEYDDEYDEYEFDRMMDEQEEEDEEEEEQEGGKKRKTGNGTTPKGKGKGKGRGRKPKSDTGVGDDAEEDVPQDKAQAQQKRVPSAYVMFLKDSMKSGKCKGMTATDASSALAPVWKKMSEQDRQPYVHMHQEARAEAAKRDANSLYSDLDQLLDASGKLQLLDRMLPVLHQGGHRILIFSQMTKILSILEDYLELKGYNYCFLDGSMGYQDRQEQIETFVTDPSVFIFLISTRAGGLGLTLVQADTVIFFDSDWNPQMDKQAMDRCHRIGQTRPVVVYRLITANSVEVLIQRRARKKLQLESLIIEKARLKDTMNGSIEEHTFTASDLKEILTMELEDAKLGEQAEGAITEEQLALVLDRDQCVKLAAKKKKGKKKDEGEAHDEGFDLVDVS